MQQEVVSYADAYAWRRYEDTAGKRYITDDHTPCRFAVSVWVCLSDVGEQIGSHVSFLDSLE